MTTTRPAAVAGTFYPGDARELRRTVEACLDGASCGAPAPDGTLARPRLLVVPHAGYVYSGEVAGQGWARVRPWAGEVRRVVLLGPAHRVALRGLALPAADALATPLGSVPVDAALRATAASMPQVVTSDRVHAFEHALEVQLPFIQVVLRPGFTVLPLAVGDADADDVAAVVEALWGDPATLVVVSSDLSHYLPYDAARAADRTTTRRILAMADDLVPDEACGARALNGALRVARRHALKGELLDLRNSGDTAGDRRRVVGYAAMAFSDSPADTDDPGDDAGTERSDDTSLGPALLARAHNSIASRLGFAHEAEPSHAALERPGATFVSLHDAGGELRGCIGRLAPERALDEDVRRNAEAAAFADPRFLPLQPREWHGLQIEVSLLGPARPLASVGSRHEALRALRPGTDGLILEWRSHRATFLPQVWEQLPEPAAFVGALARKAGLPADFWAEDLRLARYQVQRFARPAAGAGHER